MRLLVVEDQKKMAAFLKKGLTEATYAVDTAESGSAAIILASENEYDLIVLDVMLPDINGFDVSRELRKNGYNGPILMLTALAATQDKVHGLDAGADDYLTKPFAFEELLARVRALLRRRSPSEQSVLRYADIEMNLVTRSTTKGGKPLTLTQREFSLLEFFLRNPERVLSRTVIGEHVWDIHFDNESNVIDVYINMLRKKLGERDGRRMIQTVVGAGYILREETA